MPLGIQMISREIDLTQEEPSLPVFENSRESEKRLEIKKVTELDAALKDVLKKAERFSKAKSVMRGPKKTSIHA